MLLLTMLIVLCMLLVLLSKLGSIPRATATTPEPADDKMPLVRKLLAGIIGIGLFLGTVIAKFVGFVLDIWADSELPEEDENIMTTTHSGLTWHRITPGGSWYSFGADDDTPPPPMY